MAAHPDGRLPVEFMDVLYVANIIRFHPLVHILVEIIERGVTCSAYEVFYL